MEGFWSGFTVGVITILSAGILFAFIVLVYILAKLNIFFTIVQEGTAKAIKKFGKFQRMVMAYGNHALDQRGTIRLPDEDGEEGIEFVKNADGTIRTEKYKIKIQPPPFKFLGGLRWVGIPLIHSVHKYEFRWVSYEQGEKDGKLAEKIICHAEKIDYILLQDDIYYNFVHGPETSEMIPVDVDLLLTIRVMNPYKAMFRVQNWLEAILNQVKPAFRNFIFSKTLKELMGKEEKMEREVDKFLEDSGIANYAERDYGVRLKKVGMAKVDLTGERGKIYTEAATKQYEAEKEKERIEITADAEVARINKVYGKINEFKEVGMFVKAMEAVETAGKGPSNTVIFPFGSVQQLLEGWLGKEKRRLK